MGCGVWWFLGSIWQSEGSCWALANRTIASPLKPGRDLLRMELMVTLQLYAGLLINKLVTYAAFLDHRPLRVSDDILNLLISQPLKAHFMEINIGGPVHWALTLALLPLIASLCDSNWLTNQDCWGHLPAFVVILEVSHTLVYHLLDGISSPIMCTLLTILCVKKIFSF